MKIAILDDYQGVALGLADWEPPRREPTCRSSPTTSTHPTRWCSGWPASTW